MILALSLVTVGLIGCQPQSQTSQLDGEGDVSVDKVILPATFDLSTAASTIKEMHFAIQAILDDQSLVKERTMEVTLKNGDKTEIVIRPRFGMGRMEGVNTIHDIPSPEELAGRTEATEHMAKLLAKMEESGWVVDGYYAASSAFYGRKELDFFEYQKDRRLTRVYNDELYKWTKPIEKFTKATTKVLDDGTCFFALPIHITKESCLNCHGDVKVGDTKGYMVYVIRKSAVENPPT